MEELKIVTPTNGWIVELCRTKDWEVDGVMHWKDYVTIAKIIGYTEKNTPITIGKTNTIEEWPLGEWTKEKRTIPIIVDTLKEAKEIAAIMIKGLPNEEVPFPDVHLLGYGDKLIITEQIEAIV